MITVDDYLYFTDRALDGMSEVLQELGDDLANRRPELPGANSPYGIVTHCLGVMNDWAGRLVAGREVERDRDAEFRATGPVRDLVERIEQAREQLRADVSVAELQAPLRALPSPPYRDTPIGRTQGAALQHVYEELAQHRGHLELTRDILRS
ncbi:mycothiol transferase [Pseudonocardia sp. TRM90224]|uniref:mycothiol transferase n=1 Tax=Pseudonocardia sp. TRM90224 TaxID=2812678 RepID=UPI001E464AC9|nr:DUF664 domain-containing protein [Pseudonocardia sp. TRM90224]